MPQTVLTPHFVRPSFAYVKCFWHGKGYDVHPEEHPEKRTSKGQIFGEIEIRQTSKSLKSYAMEIHHEGSIYLATKTVQ